jgi:hypothetical protein
MTEKAPASTTGARWVKVAEIAREDHARLLAGRLENEGIPVTLSPEQLADIYGPGTSAFLGKGIEIYVPEDRLLQARQLIEELEKA